MNSDTKALVIVLIVIGVTLGGALLVATPVYFLLPVLLENSSKDAISILSTYKLSLILFYVAVVLYVIGTVVVTILFSTKVATTKLLAPRMVAKVYVIIFLFSAIGFFLINDNKENFEIYSKVSSDLEQYETGDVEYANVMIYMDEETNEFESRAIMCISDNYEAESVFESIKTFDPEQTDEDFEGVNKGVTRYKEMFTYYALPENVDFDADEVQKVAPFNGEDQPLDEFYESLEPLYESNAVYKIGYTSEYGIIYSIQKVNN